ncbi:MAG: cell wall hydrolase [Xanthobacteraceae bacterium]
MVASRNRPEGGLRTSLGLGVMMLLALPSEVGYQDLATLLTRQPVVNRAQKTAFASTFGTIHEAPYNLPEPVGASIPVPPGYTLAGLDHRDVDMTGSLRERLLGGEGAFYANPYAGPVIDRSRKGDYGVARKDDRRVALKGDRLKSRPQGEVAPDDGQPAQGPALAQQPRPAPPPVQERQADVAVASPSEPATPPQLAEPRPEADTGRYSLASAGDYRAVDLGSKPSDVKSAYPMLAPPRDGDKDADRGVGAEGASEADVQSITGLAPTDVDPSLRAARIYFGSDPMGQRLGTIVPWAPGEEPKFETKDVVATNEANMKLAALPADAWSPGEHDAFIDPPVERASLPPLPSDPGVVFKDGPNGGQTVARKGEVTGVDQRPMSPAERLGLDETSRPKSEKCLADAIYFEARGEHVRGQMAVAQVVLNRAFSGKYPSTVCGVVYQNAHRHLACQFTFACDGIPDVVREPDMWERAKTIAAEMLDGKLWLPEVGKATHYHAYWVRPGWVREMTKMHKLGVHTFYRPRKWGDGEDAPEWGDPEATLESAKKLVEAAKKL